jgi:hypothetical protein
VTHKLWLLQILISFHTRSFANNLQAVLN